MNNLDINDISLVDIENHKLASNDRLDRDLSNLLKYPATENKNSFCGNTFQYHFQLKNLLKCRRENNLNFYETWNQEYPWLIEQTKKMDRSGASTAGNIFECFRRCKGSIVLFKAVTAKFIYKKYKATKVLDPTAGWGGRMLGAWSLGLDYTGIDTNTDMKESYNNMIQYLENYKKTGNIELIWEDTNSVDYSKIDYDFVLTSPPYVNLELYNEMTPWNNDAEFYRDFFIPMWKKSLKHIKEGGKVCFNISPKMYDAALSYGLEPCDIEENLLQQLGKQHKTKKQDKIYIWSK